MHVGLEQKSYLAVLLLLHSPFLGFSAAGPGIVLLRVVSDMLFGDNGCVSLVVDVIVIFAGSRLREAGQPGRPKCVISDLMVGVGGWLYLLVRKSITNDFPLTSVACDSCDWC